MIVKIITNIASNEYNKISEDPDVTIDPQGYQQYQRSLYCQNVYKVVIYIAIYFAFILCKHVFLEFLFISSLLHIETIQLINIQTLVTVFDKIRLFPEKNLRKDFVQTNEITGTVYKIVIKCAMYFNFTMLNNRGREDTKKELMKTSLKLTNFSNCPQVKGWGEGVAGD